MRLKDKKLTNDCVSCSCCKPDGFVQDLKKTAPNLIQIYPWLFISFYSTSTEKTASKLE